MEYELLEKLANIFDFNDELANILIAITKDIHKEAWDPFVHKLSLSIVSFTCQTKYLNFGRKNTNNTVLINKVTKKFHDYCLDIILQLLLKIIK